MSNREHIALPAPHEAIRVSVEQYEWGYIVEYRAPSFHALIRRGCISADVPSKVSSRKCGRATFSVSPGYRMSARKFASSVGVCIWINCDGDDGADHEQRVMNMPGVTEWFSVPRERADKPLCESARQPNGSRERVLPLIERRELEKLQAGRNVDGDDLRSQGYLVAAGEGAVDGSAMAMRRREGVVGRLRRPMQWAVLGCLIVPNWPLVRARVSVVEHA
jgi:hypothetical protein